MNNGYHASPAGESDQRGAGFDRDVVGVDIGAYEEQAPILVVDNLVDELDSDYRPGDFSLREAINLANSDVRVNEIQFADDLNDAADPNDKNFIGPTGTIDMTLGELTITSDLSIDGDNRITVDGGAAAGVGGSRIFNINDGTATNFNVAIAGLTLQNGNANDYLINKDGGAIFNSENLTISNSTFRDNFAIMGGGIFTTTINASSTTIKSSTFYDNTAGTLFTVGMGGGVFGDASGGNITIKNSTFADNKAVGDTGAGGGIHGLFGITPGTEITINNSTISGNTADGLFATGGGLSISSPFNYGVTNISSTILAHNSAGAAGNDLSHLGSTLNADHNLIMTADGHNVDNVSAAGEIDSDNIIGVNPLLDVLADNGGPTMTMALLAGSPALNNGTANALSTDQRGTDYPRNDGSGVDIGAFEDQNPRDYLEVDSLVDEDDTDYSKGDLSLREAIELAMSDFFPDTIKFADDLNNAADPNAKNWVGNTGTINMLLGEFGITDNLTIDGEGRITIDGQNNSRIFNINDISVTHPTGDDTTNIDVTLAGLTLQNGSTPGSGGAIYNRENLEISHSTISGNRAGDSGGGVYSLSTSGTTAILNSTISDNQTNYNAAGSDYGGGVYIRSNSGTATIFNSTISNNFSTSSIGMGGGLFVDIGDSGQIDIKQSTFSGNTSGFGGGIFALTQGNVTTAISNSTITNNVAFYWGGGVQLNLLDNNPATISSTIIANNNAGIIGSDLFNALASPLNVTYSLIETADGHQVDNSTLTGLGLDNNNILGVDPLLAPLADNGGPTWTHALLATSPALNSGAANTLQYDQRNNPWLRDNGAGADIGAYEYQDPPQYLVVDNLVDEFDYDYSSGDLSLREAIELAKSPLLPDIINFAYNLNDAADPNAKNWVGSIGTIDLTLGELTITENITIDGEDRITIDGGYSGGITGTRIFNINDGDDSTNIDVTLTGLTLQNGNGGESESGGAIYSRENLAINDSTITGSNALDGGGVFLTSLTGTTTISNSTISANTASGAGGGVFASSLYGVTTIENSTISGNTASLDGGGVWSFSSVSGSITISNSTLSGNDAVNGGGLYALGTSGSTTIQNSTVAENSAVLSGGGIWASSPYGITTISSTIIGDNTAGLLGNNLLHGSGILDVNYSLIGTADGHAIVNTTNIVGVVPLLAPLAYNGGPTMTHALLAGSPAFNNGIGNGLANDQRGSGYPRDDGSGVDIGAFEGQSPVVNLEVDNLVDEFDTDYSPGDLSLREAIELAKSPYISDTINFADNLNDAADPNAKNWIGNTGTINMLLGEFGITSNLTINGDGRITIDGGYDGSDPATGTRIFNIDDRPAGGSNITHIAVTLNDLVLQNGNAAGPGGAVYSVENLTINDSTVTSNRASGYGGGGVFAYTRSGTITISNSTISNNSTSGFDAAGGGVSILNILGGTTTISNSTISGNFTTGQFAYGGGVHTRVDNSTTIISNSTISSNYTNGADAKGGGVFSETGVGTTTISSTIIGNNSVLPGVSGPDLYSRVITGALYVNYSLIETTDGHSVVNGTNIVDVDPLLDNLADNGGPTWTHALLSGSPALNNGIGNGLTTDQRGQARNDGSGVDIGAYEDQSPNSFLEVDNLVDEDDYDYSSGDLSLREAVRLAGSSLIPDTITFADNLNDAPDSAPDKNWVGDSGTITLDGTELSIESNLTIDGDGRITIDGGYDGSDPTSGSRIFKIDDSTAANIDVALTGLTLQNGNAFYSPGAPVPYSRYGGAIFSQESLTVNDLTITENRAEERGGGIFIMNDSATTEISNSTISHNTTQNGGGIFIQNLSAAATTTVSNSTINNNSADYFGGGVFAQTYSGTTTIENSTIHTNTADQYGGGIGVFAEDGTVIIQNSTIYDNTVTTSSGGGIAVQNHAGDTGITRILNSTVSHNTSSASPPANGGGVFVSTSGGSTYISSTIIANNNEASNDNDLFHANGTLTVENSLIETEDASHTVQNNVDGNIVGYDPSLGPLADNGGPTMTMALLTGSRALDAGVANGLHFDQRNVPWLRNVGTDVDIGAYESQSTPQFLEVDNLVDEFDTDYSPGDLSLREAIDLAERSYIPNIIRFADNLNDAADPNAKNWIGNTGTINMTLGEFSISSNLTIDGEGRITIDGGYDGVNPTTGSRIFNIDDGNLSTNIDVTLNGLTLQHGNTSGGGAAVYSRENLTISNSTITGNRAGDSGAGMSTRSTSATTIIKNSTISDNSTYYTVSGDGSGGGIHAVSDYGRLEITNSTISGNSSTGNGGMGGGLYADINSYGRIRIEQSTFSGNEASSGGGIFATANGYNGYYYTRTEITNSTITDNTATYNGGGVVLQLFGYDSATIRSTIIANNSAGTIGNDLYNEHNSRLNVGYSLIGTTDGHQVDNNPGTGYGADYNNIIGADPVLAPLADNGGPTMTHALLATSPALNSGFAEELYTDQRNGPWVRDDGNGVDIGSYEYQGPPQSVLVDYLVDELDNDYSHGDLSLREALKIAHEMDSINSINFASLLKNSTGGWSGSGTIEMTLGEYTITKDLTINGDGRITLDAQDDSRIFNINDGTATSMNVTLNDFTLTNGNAGANYGGAIYNWEQLSINNSTISDSSAEYGGGIHNYGVLAITNSTISGNSANKYGGGIYNSGSMTISNSTISDNNTTYGDGGGIQNSSGGTLTVSNSTIAHNTAGTGYSGGGISNRGIALISSSIIGNNSADGSGDDLYLDGGTFTVTYSLVETDNGGHGVVNGVDNNLVGFDPLLGPLAYNGGPTMTHALLSGSPALNNGIGNGLANDQRGVGYPRDDGSGVDIGAYEAQTPEYAVLVDNLVDELDSDYSAGDFSLREALAISNAAGTITTIEFADNLNDAVDPNAKNWIGDTGTINIDPTYGEFIITSSVTIDGDNRITIDGDNASRIFNINDIPVGGTDLTNIDVTLTGLTLQNGNAGAAASGGAVYSRENLTINDSTISGSTAQVHGGGVFAYSHSGSITINNSTVTGNSTTNLYGGGIFIETYSANTTISNSTFSSNVAGAVGGGISVRSAGGSTTTIQNSTIAGNIGTWGGGVFTNALNGTVNISSTVIGNNYATYDGDDLFISSGTVNVEYSLIESADGHQVDNNTATGTGLDNNNIIGDDPELGPLKDNGGPTMTHMLLAASPARNAGTDNGLDTDQRGPGFARTLSGGTDIGAVEFSYVVDNLIDELDLDSSHGDYSLREAIRDAEDGEVIVFAAELNDAYDGNPKNWVSSGTIVIDTFLTTEQFNIDKSLTIDGDNQRITIDGDRLYRIFNIDDGNDATHIDVTLTGLILQNGNSSTDATNMNGGAIYNRENLTVTNTLITGNYAVDPGTGNIPGGHGGGIFSWNGNGGTTTIRNSTISDNFAKYNGGGVYLSVEDGGSATIDNTIISGNTTGDYGGGVFASAVNMGVNTITNNTSILNNTTTAQDSCGGGLYLYAAFSGVNTVRGVTISENSTVYCGGGVFGYAYRGGSNTITGSTIITNNEATGYTNIVHTPGLGGGVFLEAMYSGSNNLSSSTISSNKAERGGGIFAEANPGGTNNIVSATVSGNNAEEGGGIFALAENGGSNTISNSIITNNKAAGYGREATGEFYDVISPYFQYSGGNGGGIFAIASGEGSTNTITDSTIFTNRAVMQEDAMGDIGGDGGNLIANGGGIFALAIDEGQNNISYTLISQNSAGQRESGSLREFQDYNFIGNGGGVFIGAIDGGINNITDETLISGNRAQSSGGNVVRDTGGFTNDHLFIGGNGGGVFAFSHQGTNNITDSTISNNRATGSGVEQTVDEEVGFNVIGNGGGIFLFTMDDGDPSINTISNCTISGNYATGWESEFAGNGGGIFAFAAGSYSTNTISNSQITSNFANGSGTSYYYTSSYQNTLLGGNGGGICAWAKYEGNNEITGSTISGNVAIGLGGHFTIPDGPFFPDDGSMYIGGNGGGIFAMATYEGINRISDSTISANHAQGMSGVRNSETDPHFNIAGNGGGIFAWAVGGANVIYNSEISNNTAQGYSGWGYQTNDPYVNFSGNGGGIFAWSLVDGFSSVNRIENCTVSGNSALASIRGYVYEPDANSVGNGGGIFAFAYGQDGENIISNSQITFNRAVGNYATPSGNGGGIFAVASYYGTNIISQSTISYNQALGQNTGYSGGGGGIFLHAGEDGTNEITGSTISGNSAFNGGGIYAVSSDDEGINRIANSTITGNSAVNDGGGIFNSVDDTDPAPNNTYITNSTVAFNSAGGRGGGLFVYEDSEAMLVSSIIANNSAVHGQDIFDPGQYLFTYYSMVLGPSYEASYGGTVHGVTDGVDNNIVGADPLLGALADNGGPTMTHMLLAGSLAIAAGNNPYTYDYDQRGMGYPRERVNGEVDMGAVQYAHTHIVDNLIDELDADFGLGDYSLREAITNANPGDTIIFADQLNTAVDGLPKTWVTSGTINMTPGFVEPTWGGQFEIIISLTIDGDSRVTIDALANSRIFSIDDADDTNNNDVTLTGLTIQNGSVTGRGGGIYSRESLTVSNSTITGNRTTVDYGDGGGIFIWVGDNGSARIENSTISDNSVSAERADGGGIFALNDTDGTIIITNSNILNNSTTGGFGWGDGGGICLEYSGSGTITIENSTVSGNTAGGEGGGIYAYNEADGTITIQNSTVSDNTTTGVSSDGGGICLENSAGGTMVIQDSSISGNFTRGNSADGGGIYAYNEADGTITIQNSTISGNFTRGNSADGGGIYALNEADGTITIQNSTVSDNTTIGLYADGGGIYAGNEAGGTITIQNSTVSGNTISGHYADGGGIYAYNEAAGKIAIHNSIISYNTAAGNFANGGGIFSSNHADSTITIDDSTLSGNTSGDDGGGVYAYSDIDSTATINNASISGNSTENAGGGVFLHATYGSATITGSTITENSATYGGGVFTHSFHGTTTISYSTISDNTADYTGGGIDARADNEGINEIVNSTISGNTAIYGGGIHVQTGSNMSRTIISNSTVAFNTAEDGGGLYVADADGPTYLDSTIIGNNTATLTPFHDIYDEDDSLVARHSLVQDPYGSSIANGVDGNITGSDPMLAPLADNGGPTLTHALLEGSPAIAAGLNPLGLQHDQRGIGYPRNVGGVDIGAIEYFRTHIVDNLVDEFDDDYTIGDYSLREAIDQATYGDKIIFAAELNTAEDGLPKSWVTSGTIHMVPAHLNDNGTWGGQFEIITTLSIDGDNRVTIDAGGNSRIFMIEDFQQFSNSTVALTGLTIQNGSSYEGGGILNNENLSLSNSTITGNSAGWGGGIATHSFSGTTTIDNCTITENSAYYGGGGIAAHAILGGSNSISNSTVSCNIAGDGGGVHLIAQDHGTNTVSNSTISCNTAAGFGWYNYYYYGRGNGGGIFASAANGGTNNIDYSTISNNTASGLGLFHLPGKRVRLLGPGPGFGFGVHWHSYFTSGSGGGIFASAYSGGSNNISNSTITGNTASGFSYHNPYVVNGLHILTAKKVRAPFWGSHGLGSGGGIFASAYSGGTNTISNSTISDNHASSITTYWGGGVVALNGFNGNGGHHPGFGLWSGFGGGSGGGVFTSSYGGGTNIITNSTISNNSANSFTFFWDPITWNGNGNYLIDIGVSGMGGGISSFSGPLSTNTISNSTISGNIAGNGVLDLDNNCDCSPRWGITSYFQDFLSNNLTYHYGSAGGGIFASTYRGGSNVMVNSTISGNTAYSDPNLMFFPVKRVRPFWGFYGYSTGGGIHTTSHYGGNNTISNSTISHNTALYGGGVSTSVDYGAYHQNGMNPGFTRITSTIIGNNRAQFYGNDLADSASFYGRYGHSPTQVSFSLIESSYGHYVVDGVDGNIVGLDPRLGPLADNGGPTRTHALLEGSPALNSGSNPMNLMYDQRGEGFPRNDGTGVDMGAYEDPTGLGIPDEDPDIPPPTDPDQPDPTCPPLPNEPAPPSWWPGPTVKDPGTLVDFIGREYSSWSSFYAELQAYYGVFGNEESATDILMKFFSDLEELFGPGTQFWLDELQPIFEHDPIFQKIINEMGLILDKLTEAQPEKVGNPPLVSLDANTDTDWYLGIKERLKRHPAFESEVDKLLAGILT